MIPMDIPIDAALTVGTPASPRVQPAAASAAASSSRLPGRAAAGGCQEASFHDQLRAVRDQMRAAEQKPRPESSAGHPRSEDDGDPQPAAADITEAPARPADDAQRCPESNQDPADLWSFLLQALEGISTALQPAESVAEPEAGATGAEVPEDDAARSLLQLLDILKQLQEPLQDGARPGAGAARLAELCDQLKAATAAVPSAGLPGQIHQLLQDLREHLSGMAWGRMMKEIAAAEPVATPEAAAEGSAAHAPDAVQSHRDSLAAFLRKVGAEAGPAARNPASEAIESRAASTPSPLPEDAKPQSVEREPLVRVPSAAAVAAPHAAEGGRGLETARAEGATADAPGSLAGIRDDQGAPAGGDRQAADGRLIAQTFAEADAAKMENSDAAEPFDMGTAGQRLLHLREGGSEKAADAVGTGKEKEAAGAGRAGVFDQIVQRAIVQVKAGQSEIKIDLKPDFLGNVRMQIVSENQQVSVRILTELPVVRDMIETGLQQLRSELQNQGLHVDRLEVAVSDDPRQSPRRQARPDELQKGGGTGAVSSSDGPAVNGRSEPIYYQRRNGSAATIDMFV